MFYSKYNKYKKKYFNLKEDNKIILKINNIKIFYQNNDLCWLHTPLVLLFFSDLMKDIVWNKCFILYKDNKKNFIPIRSIFYNKENNYISIFFYLLLEIIKNFILILKYKSNKDNIIKNDKALYDLVRFSRKIKVISDIVGVNGGYYEIFLDNFLEFYDINSFAKIFYDEIDESNRDKFLDIQLKNFNYGIILYFEYNKNNGHVVSIFKFNNKWIFYDNVIAELFIELENIDDEITYLRDIFKILKIKKYKYYDFLINFNQLIIYTNNLNLDNNINNHFILTTTKDKNLAISDPFQVFIEPVKNNKEIIILIILILTENYVKIFNHMYTFKTIFNKLKYNFTDDVLMKILKHKKMISNILL